MSEQSLELLVAEQLVSSLKQEVEEIGATLSDYDIDSFSDMLDDFNHVVTQHIKQLLKQST